MYGLYKLPLECGSTDLREWWITRRAWQTFDWVRVTDFPLCKAVQALRLRP